MADTDLYDRYEAAFEGIEAPFAFVDLDALATNATAMLERAAGKPIRVASKSIRCREILERAAGLDRRFGGVLCFTLPEALFLAEHGFTDLLVGYPTTGAGRSRGSASWPPSARLRHRSSSSTTPCSST